MKKEFRELFLFTQQERRGVVFLLSLIVVVLMVNWSMLLWLSPRIVDTSQWEREVDVFIQQKQNLTDNQISVSPMKLSSFDPNQVSEARLLDMGVPRNVAANWLKYLDKGGRFKSNSSVGKIYGMTPELFEKLSPYIEIDNVKQSVVISKDEKDSIEKKVMIQRKANVGITKVELNGADSVALVALPGIGPTLAVRILKYRKMLGGFYDIEQLRMVYGLKEEHFQMASPHLNVDADKIELLNINFLSASEMGRHPYIGYKNSRKIVKLRDSKGPFVSPADLELIFSADSLKQLTPYLIFNQ